VRNEGREKEIGRRAGGGKEYKVVEIRRRMRRRWRWRVAGGEDEKQGGI
jgi:hypothetical protein